MHINVQSGDVLTEDSPFGALGICEGNPLADEVAGLLQPGDFEGKPGQTVLLYPLGALAPDRLLLIGLGPQDKVTAERLRQAAATAVRQARDVKASSFTFGVHDEVPVDPEDAGRAFAEGIELGAYRFWQYRTGLTDAQTFTVDGAIVLTTSAADQVQTGVDLGSVLARAVALARDLVNTPPGDMTPPVLADAAVAMADRVGVSATVLDMNQLTEQGFGGVLAVGKGSYAEPRFIVLEYGADLATGDGTDVPTVCLVGKGLTFDSGGLSIKPAAAMETMKNDMGGGAAVIAVVQAVAELELPIHVVGLISAAENMPSGRSYRPGDVVTTLSGKTIEVLNTDAEGRVILSDALFYAQRYEPDAVVEMSTLTGAIIVALGRYASGLMATDQALADRIIAAGEASGDRVWQLPLWDEYHEMVKSDIGDVKNLAGQPAGSITAGAFLTAFVGDYPFVHLDIAGSAWVAKPERPYEFVGGTGAGVRVVTEYLRRLAG